MSSLTDLGVYNFFSNNAPEMPVDDKCTFNNNVACVSLWFSKRKCVHDSWKL